MDTARREGSRFGVLPLAAVIATLTIGADQLTKELALSALEGGNPRDVVWKLRWNLIYNEGSAFSLGTSFGPIIGVVALVISAALLWHARKVGRPLIGGILGLIVGGALGNVLDRLFREGTQDGFMRGAVIDFIDFQFWPVFNVADMAIVTGAIAMVLIGLREPVPDETEAAELDDTHDAEDRDTEDRGAEDSGAAVDDTEDGGAEDGRVESADVAES